MEKKLSRGITHRLGARRIAAALSALVVPMTVIAVAAPTHAEDAPATAGVIAFVQQDPTTGSRDIFSMNADGTDRTQLTTGTNDTNPVLSPDGSKIAFTRTSSQGATSVMVMNSDGTDQTQLTSDTPAAEPAWSPDGSKIAFAAVNSGNPGIFVIDANGTGLTQVTNTYSFNPSWSPDGSKIAFEEEGIHGGFWIATVNIDGSGLTPLTSWFDAKDPAWSPDGSKIAYVTTAYGTDNIYVMDADGSDQTEISTGSDDDPAWSPDGSKIVFTTGRDGVDAVNDEIYAMNPDGSDPTNLTNDDLNESEPSWGPLYVAPPKPKTVDTEPDSVWVGDTAQVGVPLTASTVGSWTIGTTTLTPHFQWGTYDPATSVWTKIPGATSDTFTPTPKQAFKILVVHATTTVPDGYAQPNMVESSPLRVSAGTLTTARPTIHGVAKVGSTLTAVAGTWRAGSAVLPAKALNYTWRANGRIVNAPRRPTLKLTRAMRGRLITVQVGGLSNGYNEVMRSSKAVGPVSR